MKAAHVLAEWSAGVLWMPLLQSIQSVDQPGKTAKAGTSQYTV